MALELSGRSELVPTPENFVQRADAERRGALEAEIARLEAELGRLRGDS